MTQKVRVALVGAGYVASRHLTALNDLPFVEVVGICDVDEKRATDLAKRFGVPRVFRSLAEMAETRPEVVHILTPPALHCALTLQALDMKCHVFVEKPMAETQEECEAMIAKASAEGLSLSVNHSLLFEPAVERALKLVDGGAIGDLLSLTYFRGSDYPPYAGGPPTGVYSQGSYPFRDLGVHALYLIDRVVGEIKTLQARPQSSGRNPMITFDEWRVSAECAKGSAYAHLSWNARPLQNEFWIQGTRGVLHVDVFLQRCHLHRTYPGPKQLHFAINGMVHAVAGLIEVPRYLLSTLTGQLKASPGIYQSVIAFHRSLRHGTPLPVSAAEGKRAVHWLASGSRSADEAKENIDKERRTYRPAPARVLVTGASGFVGSALVRRLCESGERPRLLLRRPAGGHLAALRLDAVYGDLGDPNAVERAVEGVEVVYHVGAATKGGAREYEAATVWGTRNIVQASLRHKIKRLIHVSSLGVLDVAGHRDGIAVNELSAIEPFPDLRGTYTQTKQEAERIVLDAVRKDGLPAVVIRPGQIFGPGAEAVPPSGVIRLGRFWVVAGNGKRFLPLVFVEDVVSGLISAEEAPDVVGRVIHLVDPTPVSQNEYLSLWRAGGGSSIVWRSPYALLMNLASACDVATRVLGRALPLSRYRVRSLKPLYPVDISLAESLLGWKPAIGVRQGLQLTFCSPGRRSAQSNTSSEPEAEPVAATPFQS